MVKEPTNKLSTQSTNMEEALKLVETKQALKRKIKELQVSDDVDDSDILFLTMQVKRIDKTIHHHISNNS